MKKVAKAMLDLGSFTREELIRYLTNLGEKAEEAARAVRRTLLALCQKFGHIFGEPWHEEHPEPYVYRVTDEARVILHKMAWD